MFLVYFMMLFVHKNYKNCVSVRGGYFFHTFMISSEVYRHFKIGLL
jgi:hypothetical protein